jgi:hypothetical protein
LEAVAQMFLIDEIQEKQGGSLLVLQENKTWNGNMDFVD